MLFNLTLTWGENYEGPLRGIHGGGYVSKFEPPTYFTMAGSLVYFCFKPRIKDLGCKSTECKVW